MKWDDDDLSAPDRLHAVGQDGSLCTFDAHTLELQHQSALPALWPASLSWPAT